MTDKEIMQMAREAGAINCDCCLPFWPEDDQVNWEIFFERFAALAYEAGRKNEREACAKVCDDQMEWGIISPQMKVSAGNCADLIRAREQK